MRKSSKKRVVIDLLILLLAATAILALLYGLTPVIFKARKSHQLTQDIRGFYDELRDVEVEAVEKRTSIPYEELYTAFVAYNEELYQTEQRELNGAAAYQAALFDLTEYGLSDNIFGVLTIPKLELEMPLYLGASSKNMADGAAVLSQTSIPIGGENTNAVIAGHRGWNGYPYFLYIDKLEIGDKVTITNLWDELEYVVTEIKIVYPSDVEEILIQPGKDMVTLLTCHPPATGGRMRYLVFCERRR